MSFLVTVSVLQSFKKTKKKFARIIKKDALYIERSFYTFKKLLIFVLRVIYNMIITSFDTTVNLIYSLILQ